MEKLAKTPNGGVRSDILYLNNKDEKVSKEVATKAVIREYDEKGNVIAETWGWLDG